MQYLARGASNKVIARELDVSESTVKIHVQNVLKKLNLTSRGRSPCTRWNTGCTSRNERAARARRRTDAPQTPARRRLICDSAAPGTGP